MFWDIIFFLFLFRMQRIVTDHAFSGVGLRDSPVGLAAYIIEKFTTWTNPAWKNLEDGGLTKKFTYEKLLDNVMIYWVTRSITTSVRLYAETMNSATMSLGLDRYDS